MSTTTVRTAATAEGYSGLRLPRTATASRTHGDSRQRQNVPAPCDTGPRSQLSVAALGRDVERALPNFDCQTVLTSDVPQSGRDVRKDSPQPRAIAEPCRQNFGFAHDGQDIVIAPERNQRSTQVSARIVAQLLALQGVSAYAIEFVDPDDTAKNFWGISFPTSA